MSHLFESLIHSPTNTTAKCDNKVTGSVCNELPRSRHESVVILPNPVYMADLQDSLQEQVQHEEQPRRAENVWREEERRRDELRRQEEKVQEIAARCRILQEENAKEQLEAAKLHAAEARRGAEWAQAAAVVAVVAATARAFFRK